MKSRKNPKKYIVGGIIGGIAGLGQAIYGGIQANKAKKEMERIQKTAPDLNAPISTPSEYFKAYKESYDQDIMNRQMESIKSGLAGTTESCVRPRISELRAEGNAIYTNETKNGTVAYRLGTPSRRMVAAAYAAMGSDAFTRT